MQPNRSAVDLAVGRRVLSADVVVGRLAVAGLGVQIGSLDQVVQVAVVGAVVEVGERNLRSRVAL